MIEKSMIAERLRTNAIGFDEALPEKISVYLRLLGEWNQKMDLTAANEEDEWLDKHFIDSLSVLKTNLLPEKGTVIDVGTGAGFPGLVLAAAREELNVTLLDSQQKRLQFLNAVANELGLKNVKLVHARAEDAGRSPAQREQYDLAVARAVAPLDVLCELLLPFVRVGGKMICWKGPALTDEMETGRRAAFLLGGQVEAPVDCLIAGRDWNHVLLPVIKNRKTPSIYPRKAGEPKRHPLGASSLHNKASNENKGKI